jgi:penicillin-binding protein 1A
MHKSIVRFLRPVSALITGILVVSSLIAFPYLMLTAPTRDLSLTALEPPSERTLVLYGRDGKAFAQRGGCVDKPVSLAEVPDYFVDALLSMEDQRFYYHLGIDPIGVTRAAVENRAAGRVVQGGSTITQQLIKNSLLSRDRTLERKKKEAWLALALELRLSKKEILERYLSSAYFGEGCYGLRAAAKEYYDVPVSKLSLPQAAYLVALLKSPTYFVENPKAAEQRATAVLDAMVQTGKLSESRREPLEPAVPQNVSQGGRGGYYADWVADTLRVPYAGDYSPLPVHTTYDPKLQGLAEETVEMVLSEQGKKRDAGQVAMVVMRADGRVLAMVGGRSHADSQFNRAVQARRQPGSSFKLFVYLAALRGGLKPSNTVVDRPISIGDYQPENFSHRYRGAMSVRRAFSSSINTVAVQLSEAVGRKPVIDAARDLGITTPLKPQASLALGAFEVNLLELTSAYAAVAAGAYPVKPWAITGFEMEDAYSAPPGKAGKWLLQEQEDMLTLLNGTVERGTGRRARLPIRAYGKTGTSSDYRDAWFIGFAGNLVVGVWVGNDDFTPMKRVTGGSLPAEIWVRFMRKAIEEDKSFERELPQIAAFSASPREDVREVNLVSNVITPRAVSQPKPQPQRKRQGLVGSSRDKPPYTLGPPSEKSDARPKRQGGGFFGRIFKRNR